MSVTGVPTGSSRSSSTASASIETAPTTRQARPSTCTSRPGQVPAEAVRVADRHEADPGRLSRDEDPAVPRALPRRQSPNLRERSSPSAAPARGRRPPAARRTATSRRARPRSARRRSATRGSAARPRCSRCAGSRSAGRPSPPRNARSAARAKSGSESAVARWLIRPTTLTGGTGSSDTPHRPMPVSSLRWTGTPSGIGSSKTTSSSLASRACGDVAVRGRPEDEDAHAPELAPERTAPRRRSRRTAPARPRRAPRLRRRPRRARSRRP